MEKSYYVQIRNRKFWFASEKEAIDAANDYFRRTGVILGIFNFSRVGGG